MEFLLRYAQAIIIVGSLIVLLGGYLSYRKTELDGEKTSSEINSSKQKTEENISLTEKVKEISQLNKELLESNILISQSNSLLAQRNIELSNEINKKSSSTNDYISGANSYCFIGLNFYTIDDLENATLMLYNTGTNPLSSIDIEIIISGNRKDSPNYFDVIGSTYHVDFLQPQLLTTTRIPLKLDKALGKITVNYKIATNNGIYRQISHYEYLETRWSSKHSYYDRKTNKLLFSHSD